MVVVSVLPHAKFGLNDHLEDAPHFISQAIFRGVDSALDPKVTAVLIDLLPRKLETVGSFIKINNSDINQKIFMVLLKLRSLSGVFLDYVTEASISIEAMPYL